METLFHITTDAAWQAARTLGRYEGDTLATEGFIHCSTRGQVVEVANRYYAGRQGLVVLSIDAGAVGAEIRYEDLDGGDKPFPHIYGPLPLAAVTAVRPLEPDAQGRFGSETGA